MHMRPPARLPRSRRTSLDLRSSTPPIPHCGKIGIRVTGSMPWGTHVCVFYETDEDLLETAVSYFEAGLRSNEFCVWAISDPIH
jgi:hypothetical protein